MIIAIPYRRDDPKSIKIARVPPQLLRAVDDLREKNPELINNNENKFPLDKLFELTYNCRVEYNEFNGISRIIWDDDRDYILFLLRWS